jgi:hypothetical protein
MDFYAFCHIHVFTKPKREPKGAGNKYDMCKLITNGFTFSLTHKGNLFKVLP